MLEPSNTDSFQARVKRAGPWSFLSGVTTFFATFLSSSPVSEDYEAGSGFTAIKTNPDDISTNIEPEQSQPKKRKLKRKTLPITSVEEPVTTEMISHDDILGEHGIENIGSGQYISIGVKRNECSIPMEPTTIEKNKFTIRNCIKKGKIVDNEYTMDDDKTKFGIDFWRKNKKYPGVSLYKKHETDNANQRWKFTKENNYWIIKSCSKIGKKEHVLIQNRNIENGECYYTCVVWADIKDDPEKLKFACWKLT